MAFDPRTAESAGREKRARLAGGLPSGVLPYSFKTSAFAADHLGGRGGCGERGGYEAWGVRKGGGFARNHATQRSISKPFGDCRCREVFVFPCAVDWWSADLF